MKSRDITTKDKVILILGNIQALGEVLRQCGGNKVELFDDTICAIGGMLTDMAEQATKELENAPDCPGEGEAV